MQFSVISGQSLFGLPFSQQNLSSTKKAVKAVEYESKNHVHNRRENYAKNMRSEKVDI